MYDLQLEETNEILLNVSTKDLRRSYRNILTRIPIHSRVTVLLDDASGNDPSYDHGVVMQYHEGSNSYNILFDDGEILHNVPRRHLKYM